VHGRVVSQEDPLGSRYSRPGCGSGRQSFETERSTGVSVAFGLALDAFDLRALLELPQPLRVRWRSLGATPWKGGLDDGDAGLDLSFAEDLE
jgi:hypothetical protein